MRIRTEVGELAVHEVGLGVPVFLWPSLYVDHQSLEALTGELSAERRCIVVDGPGHGDSSGPLPGTDLSACARAAMQVLDALKIDRVDWVGNAWGGHVGVVAAGAFPERLNSLAVIGSPMQPLEPKVRWQSRLLLAMLALGMRDLLGGILAKAMLSPSAPAELHRHVRLAVRRATGLSGAVRAISLGRPDLVPELGRIRCPTLFVAGVDDAMWPPELATEQAARIPGAVCRRLDGAAHLGPLERPRETAALLREHWSRTGDSSG